MAWAEQLEVAERAARAAGDLVRMKFGTHLRVRSKGVRSNLVTDADEQSEKLIRSLIAQRFPDDAVLGEEAGVGKRPTGAHERDSNRAAPRARWIVDPLDGTTNYAHGYPFFSVSIAYESDGNVMIGVVYDPVRDEMFVAQRGVGARLNGGGISVSSRRDLRDALIATGFPPIGPSGMPPLRPLELMMKSCQAVRRDGSAALDLCYVASGRYDGFWETALHPWDVAAGGLIVEEAGGRISDYEGQALQLDRGQLVSSNGAIHDAMLDVLRAADAGARPHETGTTSEKSTATSRTT
jgi:myo-inositol-1(or 4)-monophosphatase